MFVTGEWIMNWIFLRAWKLPFSHLFGILVDARRLVAVAGGGLHAVKNIGYCLRWSGRLAFVGNRNVQFSVAENQNILMTSCVLFGEISVMYAHLLSSYGSYPLNLRPFPCLPCCPLKSPMFLRSVISATSRFLPSLLSLAAAAAAAMSALRE